MEHDDLAGPGRRRVLPHGRRSRRPALHRRARLAGEDPRGWLADRLHSGEADDADAEGDTYHLWSVSLSDAQDVRDEGLTFGSLAFTPSSMVWTDSERRAAGRVHVRDLSSGEEHSRPHAGDRCNLLLLRRDRRPDRHGRVLRHLRPRGPRRPGAGPDHRRRQVTTIQDSGLDGAIAGTGGVNGLVVITAYPPDAGHLASTTWAPTGWIRVSDAIARFAMGGPVPAGQFVWTTPSTATAPQWLGEVRVAALVAGGLPGG